jgi:hypothetical protein
VGVCRAERDAELLWVASGLGEDEPALDGGEGRGRESGGVCAAPELAVGLHLSKPLPQWRLPAVKAGGDLGAGLVVRFGEFAGEAADRASPDGVTVDL